MDLDEFVAARSTQLLRTAWLLTSDWQLAEDLLQTALAKAAPRWSRIDTPDAYVRRALVTTFLSWGTRRWTGEIPTERLPEVDASASDADVRVAVLAAVRGLPRQQRAVIVLRYFADLTEAQTADAMGCSVGTVKSHTARALARLRGVPGLSNLLSEESV